MRRRLPAAIVSGLVALTLAAFLNSTHPVFPGDAFVPGCPIRTHSALADQLLPAEPSETFAAIPTPPLCS